MKIRKIKYNNHPLFGNLELDFTLPDNSTANTIIIAGENGTGKTLILNDIVDIKLQSNIVNQEYRINYEFEFTETEVQVVEAALTRFNIKKNRVLNVEITHAKLRGNDSVKIFGKTIHAAIDNLKPEEKGYFSLLFNNAFKVIFSKANMHFDAKTITTVTSKNTDASGNRQQISSNQLGSEIAQLLVDIQTNDALDFTEWSKANIDKPVNKDKMDSRLQRFINAFNYMFPHKRYKGIENKNGNKNIIFTENGRDTNINQLSSGEKQIVFRGSFLLQNRESTKGALILIDEPEISMHPTWQLKILSFLKKLFTDWDGNQTSQLFIATHSPFVIHNTIKNDKVIILKKDVDGFPFVIKEPTFYTWTHEKIVQEAFDITTLIPTDKIVIFVEGETDEKYFTRAMEIFGFDISKHKFQWIGRTTDSGNTENTGDKALNHARNFIVSNPNFLKRKLVLLYDCDTNKSEETIGNLLIRKMPLEPHEVFKRGIENQLILPTSLDIKQFYSFRDTINGYGAPSRIGDLEKMKLCNYICNELDIKTQKKVLSNLKSIIELIISETLN